MRAVVYDQFGVDPEVRTVPDPRPAPDGVVVRVLATGLCRSDWHGWMGHDRDIVLPHVPGHELAGEVVAVGRRVSRWRGGERVTVPFVCGCGRCPRCAAGQQQVCDDQFQPGFTAWGSFADHVALARADVNLVALPETVDDATAATLGCRFATAFRAVVAQGRVSAGQWVAVHGCGGVGLAAVMIAAACGAHVVAVDVAPGALDLARTVGARVVVDARSTPDVGAAVRAAAGGEGVDVSLDALGSVGTCEASVRSLRTQGRHVQVGLLAPTDAGSAVPMDLVVARELTVVGSHGLPAHAYPALLELVTQGRVRPQDLVTRTVDLAGAAQALPRMGSGAGPGVTVVVP